MKRLLTRLLLLLLPAASYSAELACPEIFGDHMVLQHGQPVAIWGLADPGEAVTVAFGGHERSVQADASGQWKAWLPPMEPSREARSLLVRGRTTLVFEDVLVGEVWLCSGQSNMEKPLGEMKGQSPTQDHLAEIKAADHPLIRLYQQPRYGPRGQPVPWRVCSPESLEVSNFSAVGYFFGRELQAALDVPVGLIHASFGGSMIEAWMPPEAFASRPSLAGFRDRRYFAWVEGVQATELYTSMIEPLRPYALRGFLWYQGEANLMDGDSSLYADKQRALMDTWRRAWNRPEAPFLFVQLAPFNYSEWTKFPQRQTHLALPAFREAQAEVARTPFAGMVATTDLAGNATDIHPIRKREVGQRLAWLALRQVHGRCTVPVPSPEWIGGEPLGDGRLRIRFSNAGTGLLSRDGQPLTHFQVAGESGHFYPASAEISGPDSVTVQAATVPHPVAVRFAWDERANPNLVNSDGLPALPFRTDSWPVQVIRSRED